MFITRVELQNVKSYRDDVVTFAEGTNAICGENGAGKTTLLEAIGFTLFDYLPYTRSDFVREGEKTATIAVSFVSEGDKREYQVVRRTGGSSDYYVYDPELEARIVSSRADVLDWLREHLGVEPNADLPALFRDAVGVPQGLLAAPFLQTASQRKPLFDRLLRVDEYEEAWKTLRETLRHLENELAANNEVIAGLESQVQRLPSLRERAETLQAEVAQIEDRLEELGSALDQATAHLEALELTEKELDALTKKVLTLTTRLEGIVHQLETAEEGVVEAKKAEMVVSESQASYNAYETGQKALSRLEEKRQQRDKLEDERSAQETDLKVAQERVKGLESDLQEVAEADGQMANLLPQVERQGELEAGLETAWEQVRSLELAEARLGENHKRLADLDSDLRAMETGLNEADQVETELRGGQAKLEETRISLTDLKSEQAALRAELMRMTEQTQVLDSTQAADCPVCEQPLTPKHRADLLARNRAQVGELETQDQSLAEKAGAVTEEMSKLEGQVGELEARLRQLPRPADREAVVGQITALEGELAVIRVETEQLSQSRDNVARLEGDLDELGDPRRQHERLAEKAEERASLEERLDAERHAIGALEASLAEIDQALAPFADLDQRLDEQRAALDQHQEDHRRYLENVKVATDLSARREQVKVLEAQVAEVITERDATQAQAEEVSADFDTEALAAARQRQAGLQAEQAGLNGQLGRLRQELAQAGSEIDDLLKAEKALAAEREALVRRRQLLALAEFIREVIRQAGPYVTQRVLQQVSLEAARLFSDVMADHSARLRWEQNYEIVLEKNGRDRNFQQLSGGEQMAAALAVRLALLREVSSIDLAFFDEPTSNLDDTRRDSLAEQILSVKGFSQLFVISHDDTFERVTNSIIRVRKEDGVSKVEVQ
jgi:exonuclease SbcC